MARQQVGRRRLWQNAIGSSWTTAGYSLYAGSTPSFWPAPPSPPYAYHEVALLPTLVAQRLRTGQPAQCDCRPRCRQRHRSQEGPFDGAQRLAGSSRGGRIVLAPGCRPEEGKGGESVLQSGLGWVSCWREAFTSQPTYRPSSATCSFDYPETSLTS